MIHCLYFEIFHISYSVLFFPGLSVQPICGLRIASEVEGHKIKREPAVDPDIRFKYPEFLPHPYMKWRNPIREKLERADMLNRRKYLIIPEFYVG